MRDKAKTFTRDDWVAGAMNLLDSQGIGGVRVLTVAQSLGVTRGSFYWHFRDRQDLLDSMLEWWEREMTDAVIRYVEAVEGDWRKRILSLSEFIISHEKNQYDLAIRSWARGNRKAAAALRRVMKKRLEYVTEMFRKAGFSTTEAKARGHLLAVYLMSEWAIHIGESMETRLRLLRRQVQTLTETG
jgi:AcrR family transcriptional regulator